MQEYAFLPKIGADPAAFWAESNALAKQHAADPLITYMHLLYKKAKAQGRAHRPRATWSRRAGTSSSIPASRPGSTPSATTSRATPRATASRCATTSISSGLTEIIEGTSIYKRFHNVFASEYWFEAYDLPYPKRVITDTGKTQYLFRINKGVEDLGESINQHMPEGARPIPFANMIYFGDGDTDVPSMAVMRKNGGHAIAVHPPGKSRKPNAWTCSRPAAAISSRLPTTAAARTSSSAPACCSTACSPTSACRRRCGRWARRWRRTDRRSSRVQTP